MRNYIILNNQNSNTINGLIIQELAPISKPLQRTQVETIDGRDGDIVTPLGYAAYDKKIKIGLYGTFDINEIIAYFATQGTAIFSNEPNKYYNYQILDQIDYERLVRFRVATVTMHVQPFKYSATESTLTIDASDTISGEGSNIVLDNTAEAPFNVLRHKGNATQTTYTGKNILNYGQLAYTFTANSGSTYTQIGQIPLVAGTTYYITFDVETATTSNTRNTPYLRHGQDALVYGMSGENQNLTVGRKTWTYVPSVTGDYTFGYWTHTPSNNLTVGNFMISTSSDTTFEPYVGGAPSPSPDYPQDIQVLTGDSTVKITGKNLCPYMELGWLYGTDGSERANTSSVQTIRSGWVPVKPNTTYIVSSPDYTGTWFWYEYKADKTYNLTTNKGNATGIFTTETGTQWVRIRTNTPYADLSARIQVELGSTATAYEPYQGQSYVIPFGDTYLAKIGDYIDEPVKVDGTWYIRRAIGKLVLDENSQISQSTSSTDFQAYYIVVSDMAISKDVMSDYFTQMPIGDATNARKAGIASHMSLTRIYIVIPQSLTPLSTWLSTHNTTVYYVLETPTDEAITDQDLIDALDDFYDQAHAYKGRTHITASAESGNAPAILAVDVNENNESTVTNAGNTTSRPILTIYGQGNIGVYINGVEVLQVALGDEQYITLDSVEMEAYKDTTANLKNRLVTGDYSKLALNAGANKIYFSGIVTKYEISKYSRWL